ITKAIISLLPSPKETSTLIVPYDKIQEAIKTVPEIIKNNILPLAVEFIEGDAIELTERFLGKDWPVEGADAYLMIVVDGRGKEDVEWISKEIADICLKNNAKDVFVADGKTKQKEILDFRSQMYEAMRPDCIEALDIVVPISEIANHVETVHRLEQEYKIWLPTYGHAGDGNVHTHIMKTGCKDWQDVYPVVRNLLHEDAKKRGGMISGEHGIGFVKKEYLGKFIDKRQIELMKVIKGVLDPNSILNPAKIF
ncbi:MAG: FAD-binding oxidoreductase, partial [Candidatus Omnitrophica bacterium]|nr:FAD-binding oxidoreductase [Candidatus Omnitrophota bacterium]